RPGRPGSILRPDRPRWKHRALPQARRGMDWPSVMRFFRITQTNRTYVSRSLQTVPNTYVTNWLFKFDTAIPISIAASLQAQQDASKRPTGEVIDGSSELDFARLGSFGA